MRFLWLAVVPPTLFPPFRNRNAEYVAQSRGGCSSGIGADKVSGHEVIRTIDKNPREIGRYDVALQGLPLQLPTVESGNLSAFHLYVVRLKRDAISKTHRQVLDELREREVGVNVHYIPVHLQPYYRERGFAPGQYPEAEAHGESAITLPLYAALTNQQQDQVIRALKEVLTN